MSNQQAYEVARAEYGQDNFRTFERVRTSKQSRPSMGRRRGKSPQSFNGIHRRRRRKLAW